MSLPQERLYTTDDIHEFSFEDTVSAGIYPDLSIDFKSFSI